MNLIKISVSVPIFSTESAGKPTIYDLLFLLTIYFPKIAISTFWDEKLAPEQALYYKQSFSVLGTHFEHMPQMLTYRQISSKFYFAYNVSYKKEASVKHRLIGSFFWSQWLIKDRGTKICTTRIWIRLNEFDYRYTWWCCESSFFCIYHWSKWYQKHKVCRSSYFWSTGTFTKPLVVQDRYIVKSLIVL